MFFYPDEGLISKHVDLLIKSQPNHCCLLVLFTSLIPDLIIKILFSVLKV